MQEQGQGRRREHLGPFPDEVLGSVQHEHQHVLGTEHSPVQIHLPVHQAPRHDELFNRINGLFFDAELPVDDVEHLDDALAADFSFGHPAVKAVARQVIQTIHVELAADQLVQERLGMMVVENLNRQVQGASHLVVQASHDERADVFVMDALDNAVLQSVAEGTVAYVVQEDGQTCGFSLFFRDRNTFVAQAVDGFLHQVHAADGVVEAIVNGAGINEVRQSQLRNPTKPLHETVVHQVEGPFVAQRHKPVNRVVQNFVSVHRAHPNTKSVLSTLTCPKAQVEAKDAARYAPRRRPVMHGTFESEHRWDDHRFYGLTTRSSCCGRTFCFWRRRATTSQA